MLIGGRQLCVANYAMLRSMCRLCRVSPTMLCYELCGLCYQLCVANYAMLRKVLQQKRV